VKYFPYDYQEYAAKWILDKEKAALAGPLDRFFTQVMVMVDDTAVRRNRLALLKDIADILGELGDLEKIVRE
jgi:glycyl-tRNA synthetase beta chain